jgi:CheY-like chemotaxis protein
LGESWDEMIAALRVDFLRDAAARLAMLREALDGLAASPTDLACLSSARRGFHAFAGSGATYGFPEVSALARPVDEACAEHVASGTFPDPAELAAWREAMDGIARVVHEATGAPQVPEAVETGPSVLCVEPDRRESARLKSILASAGYDVCVCGDAAAFAHELQARQPDLVLLDSALPDADAHDLVRDLRRQERSCLLPVVLLERSRDEESALLAARSGADGAVPLSASPALLLAEVESRLERFAQLKARLRGHATAADPPR